MSERRVWGSQLGSKLYKQLKRLGYYWSTMVCDYIEIVKRCQVCQELRIHLFDCIGNTIRKKASLINYKGNTI